MTDCLTLSKVKNEKLLEEYQILLGDNQTKSVSAYKDQHGKIYLRALPFLRLYDVSRKEIKSHEDVYAIHNNKICVNGKGLALIFKLAESKNIDTKNNIKVLDIIESIEKEKVIEKTNKKTADECEDESYINALLTDIEQLKASVVDNMKRADELDAANIVLNNNSEHVVTQYNILFTKHNALIDEHKVLISACEKICKWANTLTLTAIKKKQIDIIKKTIGGFKKSGEYVKGMSREAKTKLTHRFNETQYYIMQSADPFPSRNGLPIMYEWVIVSTLPVDGPIIHDDNEYKNYKDFSSEYRLGGISNIIYPYVWYQDIALNEKEYKMLYALIEMHKITSDIIMDKILNLFIGI